MKITIEELKANGFVDLSSDRNGLAYRLKMPDGGRELCFYLGDENIRYQSIGSGFTRPLKGVKTLQDLNEFCQLTYGMTLEEINKEGMIR